MKLLKSELPLFFMVKEKKDSLTGEGDRHKRNNLAFVKFAT